MAATLTKIERQRHRPPRPPLVNAYRLRFSHRYNSWQELCTVTGHWRNIRPDQARYMAYEGIRIGVHV